MVGDERTEIGGSRSSSPSNNLMFVDRSRPVAAPEVAQFKRLFQHGRKTDIKLSGYGIGALLETGS